MATPGIGPDQFVQQPRTDGINVGDQVQVTVVGYPEFNIAASVRESGTISIPLAGDIRVLGLTKDQLTEAIVAKLSEFVKTKVYATVNVTRTMVRKIIVLGAVGTQGSQPATLPLSIFQLFASVGGLAADADLRHVWIYRNAEMGRPIEFDLSEFASPGPRTELTDPIVYPGDMVYVPRAENFMRQFSPFIYDILVLVTLFRLIG
jgi:polysaccharide export outer membrane protein